MCEAFADVIDAKSPFTARHSRGVAAYALRSADARARRDELRDIRRAGLLHDIGKLGVPNSILDKPAKLTDEEFATIRLHPRFTEEILRGVAAFAPFAGTPRRTTSAWTAAATPRGSPATRSRNARILAVADVFEALTADRPYRAPLPVDEALEIMRRDVGTAFCPRAFGALESALAGPGLALAA